VCSANLLVLQGHAAQATSLLTPLVAAQPALTALAIQTLLPHKDDATVMSTLQRWALAAPSADAIKPLLPVLQAQGDIAGMQALLDALTAQLKQAPQRLATAGLLLSHSANPAFATLSHGWQAQAQNTVDGLTSRYDRPTCSHCGFKASRHQWRCPGCGRWNTLPYSA
jgi:lipopolysaccharide biosynthesis regulator YciM